MKTRLKQGCMLILLSALIGCGDEEATGAASINPCDLLTPEMITAHFSGATAVEQSASERTYPSCRSNFSAAGSDYQINLTLAPSLGSQANLERAVSVFDAASPVADLGQGAYYVEGQVNQVSVWAGEHLFHLAFHRDNAGDREQAIALARQVVKQL